jgi:Flp pilus assembly pilin Flp
VSIVRKLLLRLHGDCHGTTSIEYGVIGALISVGIILALQNYTAAVGVVFNKVETTMSDAMSR